jgi:hypothetical protein
MSLSSSALLPLAKMMGLDPVAAIALPTVIDVAARKAAMTADRMFFEALQNVALREYLADCCRKVMVAA